MKISRLINGRRRPCNLAVRTVWEKPDGEWRAVACVLEIGEGKSAVRLQLEPKQAFSLADKLRAVARVANVNQKQRKLFKGK